MRLERSIHKCSSKTNWLVEDVLLIMIVDIFLRRLYQNARTHL